MRKSLIVVFFIALLATLFSTTGFKSNNFEPDPIEKRVDSLLKQMTLDEKIGQLTLYSTDWELTGPSIKQGYKDDVRSGRCGALFNSHTVAFTKELQRVAVEESRLKIPLIFGYDVIHGYKTIFPIPLAEACSWDLQAIESAARVAGTEAAAAGLHWTFAPMVDICRDPRWGRIMEGAGEDPWLGARIAEARVRGFQGKGLGATDAVMACVKHFAGYGAPAGGRDYNTVDMSERYFREYYMPPYEAAVKAGAATVMTAFNDFDGVPASGNHFLLTQLLRNEWGFTGFVVTDYTAINEMVNHGVIADEQSAGELSISAGVDMDMQGAVFQRFLKKSLEEGRINMALIDESVRRILRLKFRLGLFENPYKYCDAQREKTVLLSKENRTKAREVARKSIVLLQNKNNVLPLDKKANIALIGPLGDNKTELIGAWSGSGNYNDCVSLLEGMKAAGSGNIRFAKGCEIETPGQNGFSEAKTIAQQADILVIAIGETAAMSGEAACRTNLQIPGEQMALVKAMKSLGKPIVVVLMNGRPLVIPELPDYADAIVEAWWLGTEAGNALADVLYGDYNPSGRLAISFPRSEGQIPVFYNEKSTGRPFDPNSKWTSKYLDSPNTPLFPFGFGLGYTTFEYSPPSLDRRTFKTGETLTVSVTVRNTGKRVGEETVQLYVRDLVAGTTRPVKALKDFRKIQLQPNESKTIQFSLDQQAFAYWQKDMRFAPEPGEFDILIGPNAVTLKSVRVRME